MATHQRNAWLVVVADCSAKIGDKNAAATKTRDDDNVRHRDGFTRRLERQENKYWIVAFEWPTAGGTCATESRRLAKGESVNTFFEIPRGVPTDTYRVTFSGLTGKDGRTVGRDDASTPTFKVR